MFLLFFFSIYQPGDLYIEKLLTHTIKAQSNVKLKVQESKAYCNNPLKCKYIYWLWSHLDY